MTEGNPQPPPELDRHYLLLWYLVDEHGPITPTELIEHSGYSKSLVVPSLTDLKRRGHLTATTPPTDARETLYDTST